MNNVESDFNKALTSYKEGGELESLVEEFKLIINQIPNHFAAWTCLSWLQLLLKENYDALQSAKQAVKLNGQDPQARINLTLALLATNTKGVRDQIELIKRMLIMAPDLEEELKLSIEDGFSRYKDWPELTKIKKWLDF
tara:strand:+ start:2963 stop:3379 length:417 start_codon:yes stop_codon:yes gene_type:complete